MKSATTINIVAGIAFSLMMATLLLVLFQPPPAPWLEVKTGRPFNGNFARAGESVDLIYYMRRTKPCAIRVDMRWLSEDGSAHLPSSRSFEGTVSNITDGFHDFRVTLEVPETLPQGLWYYAPGLIPLGDCAGLEPVYPPPVGLIVRERRE